MIVSMAISMAISVLQLDDRDYLIAMIDDDVDLLATVHGFIY